MQRAKPEKAARMSRDEIVSVRPVNGRRQWMATMTLSDSWAFNDLLARLGDDPFSQDMAVVSVAAHRDPAGTWSLLYGSVLLGPADMATSSWLDWRAASGERFAAHAKASLDQQGITTSTFADFVAVDGDWLIARTPLTGEGSAVDQAQRWVQELMGPGAAFQQPNAGPHIVSAALEPADALAMSSPWWPASLQPLVFSARRPVIGYRFPISKPRSPLPQPPDSWQFDEVQARQPLLNLVSLVGLSVTSDGQPVPAALAIGRLRRTAWFSGVRLTENIEADITLAPDRVSLGDLEVDLEEYADDGLVQARRLRLADVALPQGSPARVSVVLPTLGQELRRQLRLYDRAGRLLDNCDVTAFLSQIKITMTANADGKTTTQHVSVGNPPATPTPVTRLAALDSADAEYTRLLTEGLDRRILDDPATALAAIQDALQDARDDLLVLDPYFGHKPTDWAALQKVSVPVRVLTMHKQFARPASAKKPAQPPVLIPPPPPADIQHLPRLQIRSWSQKAPWHDRVYLWADGGLTVGGSPSGLGTRLMRLDRLNPVEANAWRTRFEAWWLDQLAIQIL
ncbi:MAG TPA: hypothetical protein VIJ82_06190 [Streptosporangiaceae bacterium]